MPRLLVLSFCVLLVLSTTAFAHDQNPPLRLRIDGPPRFARPDEIFTADLVLTAGRDLMLYDLDLLAPGWAAAGWNAPRSLSLSQGESMRFRFQGRPLGDEARLTVSAELDGSYLWERTLDLSRAAYGGVLASDSDELPPERCLPAVINGGKAPTALPMAALRACESPAATPTRDGIRLYGEMLYYHEQQGVFCPVNGAKMSVVYSVGGFSWYHIDQDLGPDGLFDFIVPDGTTLYYFRTRTGNRACNVEDPFWEADYIWTTPIEAMPEGATELLAGTIIPASDSGGLHICSTLTYIHDYLASLGYDLGQIDVQWPEDNDDPSYFSPDFVEIHYTGDHTWSDTVICHEYGHYWNHEFAHYPDSDYCNGICDDDYPDDCGHCAWCPEEDRVMWKEGIAQIMRTVGIAHLKTQGLDYTVPDAGTDDIPYPQQFGASCPWIPEQIEHVFAAIAGDMVDADVGTESDLDETLANGDPTYDQLAIPVSALFDILSSDCDVEGHRPYRFDGFLRCAAEWMDESSDPDHTRANLWETVINCGIDLDASAPDQVSDITPTLTPGQPTSTAFLTLNWTAPDDDMSGVLGYAVAFTENAPAHPGDYLQTTATHWSEGPISPGTWYFTITPVDRAGRWAAGYATVGPFIITDPGDADIAPDLPTDWSDVLVLRTNPADPSPAPAIQADYVNPDNFYLYWGGRNQGTAFSGTFYDEVDFDLVDPHACSVQAYGAGNTYTRRDEGPLSRDNLAGRRTLVLRYDRGHDVAESDEYNNTFAKQFVFGPEPLDPDDTYELDEAVWRYNGNDYISGDTWWNCHGYEVSLAIYPEIVWLSQADWSDKLFLRFYDHDTGQSGFQEPLYETFTQPYRAPMLVLSPGESGHYMYCVGVAAEYRNNDGCRIHRELTTALAIPDSQTVTLAGNDMGDLYALYNNTGQEGWFSIELTASATMWAYLFEPGFALGSLADADAYDAATTTQPARLDFHLDAGETALVVVQRWDRAGYGQIDYTLTASVRKADLGEDKPADWAASVVPRSDDTLDPVNDPIPAPISLTGGSDATSVYYAFGNLSPEGGVPAGTTYELRLDGETLVTGQTSSTLPPSTGLELLAGGPFNVSGGRHCLTLHLDPDNDVTEEDEENNAFGRQWVWAPETLSLNTLTTEPAPPNPFGGFDAVLDGTIGGNCRGFKYTRIRPLGVPSIFGAYAHSPTADVDLQIYATADIDTGYTTTLTTSSYRGDGADFVLAWQPPLSIGSHYVGVTRGSSHGQGSYGLYATTSTTQWLEPLVRTISGDLAGDETLDLVWLTLPTGSYTFTLQATGLALAFSLHDPDGACSGRDTPLRGAMAVPDGSGGDLTFQVEIPSPAPSSLVLAVWRPALAMIPLESTWTAQITDNLSAVGDTEAGTEGPTLLAAPNPFNPATEISFRLDRSGMARLAVYDVGGRLVKTLVDGVCPAGRTTTTWRGIDRNGRRVASGAYFLRLETARGPVTQKVLLAE